MCDARLTGAIQRIDKLERQMVLLEALVSWLWRTGYLHQLPGDLRRQAKVVLADIKQERWSG